MLQLFFNVIVLFIFFNTKVAISIIITKKSLSLLKIINCSMTLKDNCNIFVFDY